MRGAEARADPCLVAVRQLASGGAKLLRCSGLKSVDDSKILGACWCFNNFVNMCDILLLLEIYITMNCDLSFASCMVGEALSRWAEASPELPCSFAMWVVDNVEELHKSLPRTRFFSLLAASRVMQSNAEQCRAMQSNAEQWVYADWFKKQP